MQAVSLEPAFGSGRQRASVCVTLLTLVGAGRCWTESGPALVARLGPSQSLDPDARPMLAACWALWEGGSALTLNELLRLSPPRLEIMGELLTAIARGPAAIDTWLERYGAAQDSLPNAAQSRAAATGRSKLTR